VREPEISSQALETWARFLTEHSLGGISPGERVMIKGERIAWPLMEVLERRVIEGGGVPDILLVPPNNDRGRIWSAAMGRHGTAAQLEACPDWHEARYRSMDKYIEILGAETPEAHAGLRPEQLAAVVRADARFARMRMKKRWVLTLFPTPRAAEMEGMELAEYTDFVVGASIVDPGPLLEAEEVIAPLIDEAERIRIVTAHPDGRELELSMSLARSLSTMSHGLRNFPDGEVFTSPDANSCEGEIFLDLPVHYGGVDIRGIHLRLVGGRIVEHSAVEGGDTLGAIIETDDGSHRLGEVAFGMNPALDRVLKNPLFVEKVGGTMHVAIGASYDNCYTRDPESDEGRALLESHVADGILNRSAQHIDIVTDFRPGGAGRRVFLGDRELVVRDRVWVPKD